MGYVRNDITGWLLRKSYGQGGTVALPGGVAGVYSQPIGDFPAGVRDVLEKLAAHCIDWPNGGRSAVPVEWCFLVGGPGNGKTEALNTLAELIGQELTRGESGQPAPRVVPLDWPSNAASVPGVPGIQVAFINDASIPRQDALGPGRPGSLFLDLVDGFRWLRERDTALVLFGNINRGILVEEKAAISKSFIKDPSEQLASQMIQWLLTPPEEKSQAEEHATLETVVPVDPKKPYYGQFKLLLSGTEAIHDILVHVVFLDALSLLEPLPGVEPGKAIDFSTSPPSVSPYKTFGGFSDDRGASREQTIAGKLLRQVVDSPNWDGVGCRDPSSQQLCEAYERCPFAQNVKWLRDLALCRRFLDTIRSAEIAASRRLTYRELLGYFSLAILGIPEKEWLAGSHPCAWVEQEVRTIEGERSKSSLAELIHHRLYANLFPSPEAAAWRKLEVQPTRGSLYSIAILHMTAESDATPSLAFDRAFNYIDPARDVDSWRHDAREATLDEIEALEIAEPSQQLLRSRILPSEANSQLETLLDRLTRDEIAAELASSTRSRTAEQRAKLLRKWRSTLLLRQVGLAIGQIAFKNALSAYLSEQYNALRGDTLLDLGTGIRALLLPESSTGKFWLAPLRPRTYSLEETSLPTSTLLVALDLGSLDVEIVPRGDVLLAEVLQSTRGSREPPRVIATLFIDLSIAREAILQSNGQGTSFTEIGASAFARIERVRASLVGRSRLKRASVYFTDELGQRYRITDNPAGPAPLRILRSDPNG